MKKLVITAVLGLVLVGCATVSTTNSLMPGLSPDEVTNLLGSPKSTQFAGDKLQRIFLLPIRTRCTAAS